MSKRRPQRLPVDDDKVKKAIGEVCDVVDGLVIDPFLNSRTISVTLPDTVAVTTKHGLGRKLTNCLIGPPVGATATGRIVRSSGDDMSDVVLTATGHGATITVLITVW